MSDIIRASRLWSNDSARREFEAQSGFSPLAKDNKELRLQIDSGYFGLYHDAFVEWATSKREQS